MTKFDKSESTWKTSGSISDCKRSLMKNSRVNYPHSTGVSVLNS